MNLELTPISPPLLLTERFVIRPLEESDRKSFVDLETASAEFFAQFAARPSGVASADDNFTRTLGRTRSGLSSGGSVRLGVFLQADRMTLAGLVAISDIVRGISQTANIGWRVHADYARQGVATESVWRVLTYAFSPPPEGLDLHRVSAGIQPDNGPSLKLAAKLGFRREGLAERLLFMNDAWRDHVIFAKTAEEHVTKGG